MKTNHFNIKMTKKEAQQRKYDKTQLKSLSRD